MSPGHLARFSLVALGALLAACAQDPSPGPVRPEPRAVVIEPAIVTIPAGSHVQLAAQVNGDDGQPIGGAPINFESRNPAMANVTATGLVVAPGPVGETTIRVASGIRSAEVTVRVVPAVGAALDVVRGPESEAAAGGLVADLQVRVRDAFGNPVAGAPLAWQLAGTGGSVENASALTGPDGVGSARWMAGPSIGSASLEVRSGSIPPQVLRTVIGTGPPASITISLEPPVGDAPVPAGDRRQVSLRVADSQGNGVPAVKVQLSSAAGCGLDPVERVTDEQGATPVTDWVPAGSGDCTLLARIENPPVQSSQPLTVAAPPPTRKKR